MPASAVPAARASRPPETMPSVTELRIAHTADLGASTTSAIRDLMNAVFGGVSDDTFDNALGGLHALLYEDGELIAHGSVVQRRLLHAGRALRTGYVEGVAVDTGHRRQGHGGTVMAELERIIRAGYHLGALGASPEGALLYTARGWQQWQGPTSAMTPGGITRTADLDGAIYVLPVSAPVDLAGELTCDYRPAALW
jgi:aminoglycoside 2'-N-acetyltransferase I